MKDTSIYDLLNNMDNEPQSYSPLDITPGELNAWKKSFTAKRTATSSRKESSADRHSASPSWKKFAAAAAIVCLVLAGSSMTWLI